MHTPFRAGVFGSGAIIALALACRDAPTAPPVPTPATGAPGFSADIVTDTVSEVPPAATIFWATTSATFKDGSDGSPPRAIVTADMEYYGNRGSHNISYAITGDEPDISGSVYDVQNRTYSPGFRHRFTRPVEVPTHKTCGLTINAHTTHQAWWHVWLILVPDWQSTHDTKVSRSTTFTTAACPPPPGSDSTGNSGGGGGGGWITIETCYYWAYYVNDVLVAIELRYCDYTTIPIAEE